MWPLVLFDGSVLLLLLFILLLSLGLFCVNLLLAILSKAHAGYLHLVKTSLACCCTLLCSSGVD